MNACLVVVALAALPPGYDDELFCPSSHCLQKRKVAQGFVGPKASFVQCLDPRTGTTSKVRPWGPKKGAELRERLLAEGMRVADACKEAGGSDERASCAEAGVATLS